MSDRFGAVLAVRDGHHRDVASAIAARLAAAGGLPLTVFDATVAPARRDDPAGGARIISLAGQHVAVDVAAQVTGRDGAMLVIDAHGGGPPGDALFDDDAEHLLTHVRQPVLVSGPGATVPAGPWLLLVPIDGAAVCDAVFPVVARWSATFPSSRAVVIALDAPDPWPADGTDPVVDPARSAAAHLQRAGVDVTLVRAPTITPSTALLDAADTAGDAVLVVPGPRSSGTGAHWFSTVRRLVRQAPCPVLVVPAEGSIYR